MAIDSSSSYAFNYKQTSIAQVNRYDLRPNLFPIGSYLDMDEDSEVLEIEVEVEDIRGDRIVVSRTCLHLGRACSCGMIPLVFEEGSLEE